MLSIGRQRKRTWMLRKIVRRVLPQSVKDAITRYRIRRQVSMARRQKRMDHRTLLNARQPQSNDPPWDFKVYSQNGEDGIVDYLTTELKLKGTPFVEFGFSPYESNLLCYAAETGAKGLF